MKLTNKELENLFDYRLVTLEDLIKDLKDNYAIGTNEESSIRLENIVKAANSLLEAHKAIIGE